MSFFNIEEHLSEYHKNENIGIVEDSEDVKIAVKTDDGRFECSEKKNLKNEEMCEKIGSIYRCRVYFCLRARRNQCNIFFLLLHKIGKVCNVQFDARKRLLLHISIHRNVNDAENRSSLIQIQKLINCQLCNRTFNSNAEQQMHMKAYHASFESHKIMKSQERITPSKGMHPCQYCQKEFKRPHEKVKHERVHTNEKPFMCDVSFYCR